MKNTPLVSIGMPVYNGEKHRIKQAIESLLKQNYPNFELLICDNDSTDNTETICRDYAKKDARIKYYRNGVNIGAAPNFARVLDLASGEYFMWSADDDLHEPSFISECLAPLLKDDAIALSYSQTMATRKTNPLPSLVKEDVFEALESTAYDRYVNFLKNLLFCYCYYGIYRTKYIRKIRIMSDECRGHDVAFLAEVALQGKIVQVKKPLFYSQWDAKWTLSYEEQMACIYGFIDTRHPNRGITFPTCHLAYELLQSIRYSSMSMVEKSKLLDFSVRLCEKKFGHFMQYEIQRAIELIHQDRLIYNWGEHAAGTFAQQDPNKESAYKFYANETLKRLQEVSFVYPNYNKPGIYYAKGICFAAIDQIKDAIAMFKIELTNFPTYQRASFALDQLEKLAMQPA